jgi:flavin-dependent dehydrogenase
MTVDKRDIVVVGAGPAGLVAAINLNREGFNVILRERQDRIGGEPGFHPSVHGTPVDVPGLWEYIGIDCSEAFKELGDNSKVYLDRKVIGKLDTLMGQSEGDAPKLTIYNTERGHRPTSLDSFLFRIAEKEGVNVEFNSPFKEDDVQKAKKGTILATGLSSGVYKWLGMDWSVLGGYWAYSEIESDEVSAAAYMGGFTNEYGYSASMNRMWYVLLFARKEVSTENLETFKSILEECEGRTFDKWKRYNAQAPKEPRLFYKDFILAGTLGGFLEPAFSFGITGALLSGKISAMAVTEPEKAEREFKRFTGGIPAHMARKREPGYVPKYELGDIWFDIK